MNIFQAIFDALAGIVLSFLLFWGSVIPGVQLSTVNTPPAGSGQAEFPAASTTNATVKPSEQKSGLPARVGGVEGRTGDPRTFGQEVLPKPTSSPLATTPPTPAKSQEQINDETRAALVNILCMPQTGLSSGMSGSGVVVDSRGVILTNAHVAQFFLLRDYITPGNVECVIRTGSPAQERYTATLLYLPPAWVAQNAAQLRAAQAVGTGEYDFAFLLINGRTGSLAALPASFAYLPMDRGYADVGEPMLLAAYPAGFLGNETVQKNLYVSSAIAYVTQLFSFNGAKNIDLFSVGGTVVSQSGSSGGAAVRLRDGTLAGIITTETAAATTGERDLRALSLAHIDDALVASGKGGIVGLLVGDLSAKSAAFNSAIAPSLTAQLEAVLNGN